MRKILIAVAVILNCSMIIAQTEFDAFKVVQNDINGTARYMSMAGAFGALGGDASAIKDNPAGLGIYRSSEFMGTINFLSQSSTSKWNGENGIGDLYKTNLNNISLVFASPTWRNENGSRGLLSSNFSFAYNRLKNINRNIDIRSNSAASSMTQYMAYFSDGINSSNLSYNSDISELFNNITIPTLSILGYQGYLMDENVNNQGKWSSLLNSGENVTPNYTVYEKGYVDEYSMGWAGNFSNIFYFGTSVNMQYINYSSVSNYFESFDAGGFMNLKSTTTTKGAGVNLKVGAIFSPLDFLRIGLSLHTPTIYSLSDNYIANLDYDNTTNYGSIPTPGDGSDYQIQSPMKINVSAAFLAGKNGLISAEYNFDKYSSTRLRSETGDASEFIDENSTMGDVMNNVRTIKIGGEYRLSDNFSLRAGFANSSAGNKTDAAKLMRYNTVRTDTEYYINNSINYLTAGLGYHESNWFVDFAYMNKMVDETFYPYNSNSLAIAVNPANLKTTNNNMVVSLGFKF